MTAQGCRTEESCEDVAENILDTSDDLRERLALGVSEILLDAPDDSNGKAAVYQIKDKPRESKEENYQILDELYTGLPCTELEGGLRADSGASR